MKILLFWLSLFGVSCVLGDLISDVTNDVGLSNVEGIIAAYGDFNSDKTTDIFVISNDGKFYYSFLSPIRPR